MQLNVLNDLAEAMKALDGKKILTDHLEYEHFGAYRLRPVDNLFDEHFGANQR